MAQLRIWGMKAGDVDEDKCQELSKNSLDKADSMEEHQTFFEATNDNFPDYVAKAIPLKETTLFSKLDVGFCLQNQNPRIAR